MTKLRTSSARALSCHDSAGHFCAETTHDALPSLEASRDVSFRFVSAGYAAFAVIIDAIGNHGKAD